MEGADEVLSLHMTIGQQRTAVLASTIVDPSDVGDVEHCYEVDTFDQAAHGLVSGELLMGEDGDGIHSSSSGPQTEKFGCDESCGCVRLTWNSQKSRAAPWVSDLIVGPSIRLINPAACFAERPSSRNSSPAVLRSTGTAFFSHLRTDHHGTADSRTHRTQHL